MEQLPKEVLEEFKKGNSVVKWNESKFNQVSPDHNLEWLNGIGKKRRRNRRHNQDVISIE